MEIVINADRDVESLWDWLQHEPALRGKSKTQVRDLSPGLMGAPIEILVVAASGGTAAALLRSLNTWIAQQRSDVTITVANSGGRSISVNSRRSKDSEALLRAIL